MPEFIKIWWNKKDKWQKESCATSMFIVPAVFIIFFGIAFPVFYFTDETYYQKITDKDTNTEYVLNCEDALAGRTDDGSVLFKFNGIDYRLKNATIEEKAARNFPEYKDHCSKAVLFLTDH